MLSVGLKQVGDVSSFVSRDDDDGSGRYAPQLHTVVSVESDITQKRSAVGKRRRNVMV